MKLSEIQVIGILKASDYFDFCPQLLRFACQGAFSILTNEAQMAFKQWIHIHFALRSQTNHLQILLHSCSEA